MPMHSRIRLLALLLENTLDVESPYLCHFFKKKSLARYFTLAETFLYTIFLIDFFDMLNRVSLHYLDKPDLLDGWFSEIGAPNWPIFEPRVWRRAKLAPAPFSKKVAPILRGPTFLKKGI